MIRVATFGFQACLGPLNAIRAPVREPVARVDGPISAAWENLLLHLVVWGDLNALGLPHKISAVFEGWKFNPATLVRLAFQYPHFRIKPFGDPRLDHVKRRDFVSGEV